VAVTVGQQHAGARTAGLRLAGQHPRGGRGHRHRVTGSPDLARVAGGGAVAEQGVGVQHHPQPTPHAPAGDPSAPEQGVVDQVDLGHPVGAPGQLLGAHAPHLMADGFLQLDQLFGGSGDGPGRQGRVGRVDLQPGAGAFAHLGQHLLLAVLAHLRHRAAHHGGERLGRRRVPRADRGGAVQTRRQLRQHHLLDLAGLRVGQALVSVAMVRARARSIRPAPNAATTAGMVPQSRSARPSHEVAWCNDNPVTAATSRAAASSRSAPVNVVNPSTDFHTRDPSRCWC